MAVDAKAPLLVRPIAEAERVGWQAYMARYHYLGDCRLVGESMRYVALLGDDLVALLAFGAASLCNAPRDQHIGWDAAAKREGLGFVANNVRFLMLPWIRQPHLASRVLGATLRRLSGDFQVAYGHPLLLAETFVDTSRFAGTCYLASNWQRIGETKGYSKRGSRYEFHGNTKAVFVFALRRRALERLRGGNSTETQNQGATVRTIDVTKMPIDGEDGLFEVLKTITDPRKRRGVRYKLQSLLAVALCGSLAGARGFGGIAEWAADQEETTLRRLRCWHGQAPSERTLRRVLDGIDVQDVDQKLGAWFARHGLAGCALAIDGKTLRGSGDGDGAPVHLLAAVVHGTTEVVAQTAVGAKTNEITRVEPLLSGLDIRGAVITADALLTQREIARHIVQDKQADYVFTVKDNQPTLKSDIEALRMEAFPPSARDDR